MSEHEKITITEETKLKNILDFLGIDLEKFYYDFVAENIDRTKFWRKIDDNKIILTKK